MRHDSGKLNKCYQLHIEGLVQGVGFRPFVFRLAKQMGLKGSVENNNKGVYIRIQAGEKELVCFKEKLLEEKPVASIITRISISEIQHKYYNGFQIVNSSSLSDEITLVSPDIAVCNECLDEMMSQKHRLHYPLTNCTNCGPRFSIIKTLPYDRPNTTMQMFSMCNICKQEYNNVTDRRFHAQPVACLNCGPKYIFNTHAKNESFLTELYELAIAIEKGQVCAFKGVGGYNLICDATNEKAVSKIREIKHRDSKPFAIMVADIEAVKEIAKIRIEEQRLLESWQRPIVLLKYKEGIAFEVNNNLSKIGIMLPYMPFHYQLFNSLNTNYLVFTSGNLSSEPIVIDDAMAQETFKGKVDKLVYYNREIYNRVDDSVCQVINNRVQVMRRSRGYAPQPIITNLNLEGMLAVGAELTNSFCIGKGNQAILSQYIGDLKNIETFEFFEETFHRFTQLFRFKPKAVACDIHNDYLSTQFAHDLAEKHQVSIIKVQHHHAHIASAMVTQGLNEKVIGVSFDGVGLGDDGNVWGAEFMVVDLNSYSRKYNFKYTAMPGGDKASEETWRMAVSYLYSSFGDEFLNFNIPIVQEIGHQKIMQVIKMIEKNINCPLASSAGRLFDAVASIVGIKQFNTYQAEAPMLLEAVIDGSEKGSYAYELGNGQINFSKLITELTYDKINNVAVSRISAKFHNTLVKVICDCCKVIAGEFSLRKVVLSGGVFQNAFLSEQTIIMLEKQGFEVYLPEGIPVNDQGIALGQMAIAANKLKLNTN